MTLSVSPLVSSCKEPSLDTPLVDLTLLASESLIQGRVDEAEEQLVLLVEMHELAVDGRPMRPLAEAAAPLALLLPLPLQEAAATMGKSRVSVLLAVEQRELAAVVVVGLG